MNVADPIRDKEKVKALADYYLRRGQIRNYALFAMGVYTALRVGDLLGLRWRHVYDSVHRRTRERVTLTEMKTGKPKTVALHPLAVHALEMLIGSAETVAEDDYVFESRQKGRAITRVQAYRIIRDGASAIGLEGTISCHSMRKTFGYHSWQGGTSPAVIMEIYNHSSYQITRRYLGVSQDDKNKAYLELNLL